MYTDIVVSTRCQANGKFQADEKLASSPVTLQTLFRLKHSLYCAIAWDFMNQPVAPASFNQEHLLQTQGREAILRCKHTQKAASVKTNGGGGGNTWSRRWESCGGHLEPNHRGIALPDARKKSGGGRESKIHGRQLLRAVI